MNETRKIGTLLFQGEKRELWFNKGKSVFEYSGGVFYTSINIEDESDWPSVTQHYDTFCKQKMDSIIWSEIRKLRLKKIKTTLPYIQTQGGVTTHIEKEVEMNVNDYLELLGYSQKIDYEIGKYQKEWGINAIDPKKKIFVLYFNLDLIKYDSGPHIEHVVAHELAHIFHRDHGAKFQNVLSQLDPSSKWSQDFFDRGITLLGSNSSRSVWVIVVFLGIVIIIVGYQWLAEIYNSFFGNNLNF